MAVIKMNATRRAFALIFVICYAYLTFTQAAVIKRREIDTKESPETLATQNIEQFSSVIQHDNVTAKSTKLMPQPVASNETELPKKTTLKIVNGPMTTTTGIEASEIIATAMPTTTQRNENFMFEFKDRVSEKQLDLQINTNINSSSTLTTTDIPIAMHNYNETLPTKRSSITLNPVNILESTTINTIAEKQNLVANATGLIGKNMDLSFDDSDDIQSVSSSKTKQPKFLTDNSTNSNQLNLPNTADVWTLAAMKNTPMPHDGIDNKNNSTTVDIKEKTLADWSHIYKTGVDNALTDDVESATSYDTNETTETLIETTTRPANISALYTTPHATITHSNEKPNLQIEEFHDKLLNHTLMTLTSTFLASTTESILSSNDNTDMQTTTITTVETIKETIKEKAINITNINKEKEELEVSTASTLSELSSSSSTAILNTMLTKQSPLEEMSFLNSSSTPATAIVSNTTERNFEVRPKQNNNQNNTSSGITQATVVVGEKEKDVTVEATTIEENQIETTIRPPSIFLASNVTTQINYNLTSTSAQTTTTATTTTQSAPDIHQIGEFKSNLVTPTTETTSKATIEIETTPINVQSILNSSAIANQTATPATLNVDEHTTNGGVILLTNVTNATAVSVTVDSLGEQSTQSEFSSLTETTTKTAVSTIKTITVTKETSHVTTETPFLEETTLNKDFSVELTSTSSATTTTEKPQVFIKQDQNNNNQFNLTSNETSTVTTTPTVIDEREHIFMTSTEKIKTNKSPESAFEMTTSSININDTSTKLENGTASPPPLIKFLDDSTTTISTSTTTKFPIIEIETSTNTLPTNTTTTSTVLSTFNNTDIIYETLPESTTTRTTIITTTTSTIVPQTTLNSLEAETTTEEEFLFETTTKTTTLKAIEEMIPTTTTTTTEAPSIPVQSETTLNPLVLHGAVGVLHPNQSPKSTPDSPEPDVNVVIAISVSVIGVVALILLVAFLYLMRKRQKQTTYGQRCRPVSLDAYSLDNVSVMGSMRKRPSRTSKRSYGNAAFQDPALRHNVIQTATDLAEFVKKRTSIFQEFDDVPKVTARAEEIPQGCEDKNRYANVIPLPETRVVLQRRNDDDTTEYINANYVRGPSDAPNYYIACQAPLEATVQDFWRMIWEQQSRVIIQATDLFEEGKERCAEYIPPSVTLDNHTTYGDFQVTLKNREVKDKYAISTLLLKNTVDNTSREITHYWYKWPETGVPTEEAPIIAMLLEARSSLKSYAIEAANELKEKPNGNSNSIENDSKGNANVAGTSNREINGNLTEKAKNIARHQGPLTVHCSPGTGRTGTIIACDMAIRSLETTKSLDIPQIVYDIRRGRASAVQTKDQYEFIYKVANVYAMKITNISNDN